MIASPVAPASGTADGRPAEQAVEPATPARAAAPGDPVRVGVIDDHPAVVLALEAALSRTPDIAVVARAGSLAEGSLLVARQDLDVILLDVRFPDGNGLDLLARTADSRRPAVIILSSYQTRQHVAAVARSGARGFVLKTAPTEAIVDAIRVVAGGGTALESATRDEELPELSTSERRLVRLVMSARSNDEIAAELGVGTKSVEGRLTRLYRRLGISSRIELAIRAEREAWPDPAADPVPGLARYDDAS